MKQLMIILSVLMLMGVAHANPKVSGEKVFKRCVACHSFTKTKIGPPLGNIFDKKIGSVKGFRYSKAMTNSDMIWNDCTLDGFLKKPRKYIKGTKMRFSGLKKKSHRDAVIEYLKENQVK
tara:strand:+ start:474 stop:833 length:360 start_codon:yes stop_codon:yes gene_type:complete